MFSLKVRKEAQEYVTENYSGLRAIVYKKRDVFKLRSISGYKKGVTEIKSVYSPQHPV